MRCRRWRINDSQNETLIDSQQETIEKQLRKLEGLERQLARLLRRQLDPQKERIDVNQLTLFTAEEIEQLAEELRQQATDSVSTDDGSEEASRADSSALSGKQRKRSGHGRRPLPDHHSPQHVVWLDRGGV